MLTAWLSVLRADEATESNMIAFVSDREGGRTELYTMLADGSSVRRVFGVSDADADVRRPVWSPDGRLIAFTLVHDGSRHINHIRPNGTGLQQLMTTSSHLLATSWSPDSKWIAYNDLANVFIIRADGDDIIQLTYDAVNTYPNWSPDGEWIAFLRSQPDNQSKSNIHLMQPDGSHLRMLTPAGFDDRVPLWSSNGEWIYFVSTLGRNFTMGHARIRLDGTELAELYDLTEHIGTTTADWVSQWRMGSFCPLWNQITRRFIAALWMAQSLSNLQITTRMIGTPHGRRRFRWHGAAGSMRWPEL